MEKENVNKLVMLNLIQHLRRLSSSFINNVRGRFQIKFGMTPLFNKGAFTLIELLVVVLIIGILATIALPQYQKAVVKARFAEAITTLKAMKQAKDLCVLREGGDVSVCHSFDPWDVTFDELKDDSGYGKISDYFYYTSLDGQGGTYGPTAQYLKEEVCLCYYDEKDPLEATKESKLVLSQDEDQCDSPEARYDYSELLKIPRVSGDECGCC